VNNPSLAPFILSLARFHLLRLFIDYLFRYHSRMCHIHAEFFMPQLHCYVPENLAQQLQRQAGQVGLSTSAYLAELVKRDVSAGWPEGFESALFGPQTERSPLVVEPAAPDQQRMPLL